MAKLAAQSIKLGWEFFMDRDIHTRSQSYTLHGHAASHNPQELR